MYSHMDNNYGGTSASQSREKVFFEFTKFKYAV